MGKNVSVCYFVCLIFFFLGCGKKNREANHTNEMDAPIVIVYENDVHCAVEGYAGMVAIKKEQRLSTPYVCTVSCGDFVQGDLVGSLSNGEYIVDIMNHVGYDVVALGNHEFDYGMKQLFRLTDSLKASVVCANFCDIGTHSSVFPSYRLIRYGNIDVAFIGFTTTSTPIITSPFTYQDEGGNTIYDFSKENFYQCAQRQIDAVCAEGADYVIALSHLGDIKEDDHPTSLNLIAQTKGLDAVLDGHSHSVIPDSIVLNCEGQPVRLSSTGAKFQYIGLLTIDTDGKLSCRLSTPHSVDKETKNLIDSIKENTIESGTHVIATNGVHLIAEDAEGNKPVRLQEMPIGNMCADAFRQVLNADVALINGGGIRANLPIGELTYNHLLSTFPFGNVACTATLTGQQLADVLECSVRLLPKENGSFMQVSGLRFEVDTSVPSPVEFDEDNLFTHVKDAPRRVRNIYVKDRDRDDYLPIDSERFYTLAGIDYHLKEMGSEGILRYATLKEDTKRVDVEVLATYIEQTLNGHISKPYDNVEGRILVK